LISNEIHIFLDEIAEPLNFNAYNAPANLAMILAHFSQKTASINHIRSVVYGICAGIRNKNNITLN
jgi:linolenate 9R-lipoxygenase